MIWSERAGAEVRVESGWEAEPAGIGDQSELNERSEVRTVHPKIDSQYAREQETG